ncbi:hypothetical protein [Fluviispira sanaruensis]|uniref:LepB N-terminal domain-containing protein n=1 Tax=Fluviispira sanaruensis TaxID=2493639 RepID=A0A4P2VY60_FLUSA|nr:hypothetical protein [Fluviispira sanaruensis]BBH53992.1 hypothetical protein JCM31447_24460 [Fluviispira sanaruensis]
MKGSQIKSLVVYVLFSIIHISCNKGNGGTDSNNSEQAKNINSLLNSTPDKAKYIADSITIAPIKVTDKANNCFAHIKTEMIGFSQIINDYKLVSGKIGGQKGLAPATGVYEIIINGKARKLLFKQGRNDGENIAEYIAANFYACFLQGYGSTVFYAIRDNSINPKIHKKADLHEEVYVGTIFFEQYNEIFKIMGLKDRPTFLTFHKESIKDFIIKNIDTNLGDVIAVALWLGDYDTHTANIGTALVNNKKEFVKVDHGWSFAYFTDTMNYKSVPWSLLKAKGKPTNHFGDYDREGFFTKPNGKFLNKIKELKSIEKEYIRLIIQYSFAETDKFFEDSGYKSFGEWIGIEEKVLLNSDKTVNKNKLIDYLTDKLYKRAQNGIK